jgi:hypothetical protein
MKVTLNDDDEKLKPCPLCCSQAFLHTDSDGVRTTPDGLAEELDVDWSHLRSMRSGNEPVSQYAQFWVKCNDLDCGCTVNATKDRNSAINRWNQRW